MSTTQPTTDEIEDRDERAAIASDGLPEGYGHHRTFPELYALEDICEAALNRPERFQGEHWCARMMLEKDIPKWRVLARALASGLGEK